LEEKKLDGNAEEIAGVDAETPGEKRERGDDRGGERSVQR
jgi:hypothetical protein